MLPHCLSCPLLNSNGNIPQNWLSDISRADIRHACIVFWRTRGYNEWKICLKYYLRQQKKFVFWTTWKPVILQTQAPSLFYCSCCFVVSLSDGRDGWTTCSQLTSEEENQDLTTSSKRQQQCTLLMLKLRRLECELCESCVKLEWTSDLRKEVLDEE